MIENSTITCAAGTVINSGVRPFERYVGLDADGESVFKTQFKYVNCLLHKIEPGPQGMRAFLELGEGSPTSPVWRGKKFYLYVSQLCTVLHPDAATLPVTHTGELDLGTPVRVLIACAALPNILPYKLPYEAMFTQPEACRGVNFIPDEGLKCCLWTDVSPGVPFWSKYTTPTFPGPKTSPTAENTAKVINASRQRELVGQPAAECDAPKTIETSSGATKNLKLEEWGAVSAGICGEASRLFSVLGLAIAHDDNDEKLREAASTVAAYLHMLSVGGPCAAPYIIIDSSTNTTTNFYGAYGAAEFLRGYGASWTGNLLILKYQTCIVDNWTLIDDLGHLPQEMHDLAELLTEYPVTI